MTSKVKDVLLAIAVLVSLGCFFYGYIQQIRADGEAKTSMELMTELKKKRWREVLHVKKQPLPHLSRQKKIECWQKNF
jgi:hypothetical protein